MNKFIINRLKVIEKEIEAIERIAAEKEKAWDKKRFAELSKLNKDEAMLCDHFKSWEEFKAHMKPEWDVLNGLNREKRLIMPYELSEIPNYGDVMKLSDFIDNVKCGGFMDYDGFGNYVKDNKMSDVEIYPSDVKHDLIREDFDTIVWFNK